MHPVQLVLDPLRTKHAWCQLLPPLLEHPARNREVLNLAEALVLQVEVAVPVALLWLRTCPLPVLAAPTSRLDYPEAVQTLQRGGHLLHHGDPPCCAYKEVLLDQHQKGALAAGTS